MHTELRSAVTNNVTPQLDVTLERLRDWAGRQPTLRRLWLFGSHARGTAGPESDVDLAFEIDRLTDASRQCDFQANVLPRWKIELQSLCDFPIQFEPWASDATNVAGYVDACNVLVYRRTT